MTETESPAANLGSVTRETALVGYQVAVDLWTNEGQQGWTMFSGMLVVNGLIIAIIGLAIEAKEPLKLLLASILSILGLSLCCIWWVFERRAVQYSDYWVGCARELEEKYLSDTLSIVSRGGLFAEGETVTIEVGGKRTSMRMSRTARIFRGKNVATCVTGILALMYLLMCDVTAHRLPSECQQNVYIWDINERQHAVDISYIR
jgi:hypothetical protein